MKIVSRITQAMLAALLLGGALAQGGSSMSGGAMSGGMMGGSGHLIVTITNNTDQTFSPPVVANNNAQFQTFASLPQLVSLAQGGNSQNVMMAAPKMPGVFNAESASAPVKPGQTATVKLEVSQAFPFITVAGTIGNNQNLYFVLCDEPIFGSGGAQAMMSGGAMSGGMSGGAMMNAGCASAGKAMMSGGMSGGMAMSGGAMSGGVMMGHAMESLVKVMVFRVGQNGTATAVDPSTMGWPNPVATVTIEHVR
jgi:hypothetical protein